MLSLSTLALAPLLLSSVAAHGYIKQFQGVHALSDAPDTRLMGNQVDGGQTMTAQKTDISKSAFRAVPQNTGWIGSNFLSSSCLVCGCQNTPLGTVAAPGGTNFADASQSAGLTPSIAAGKSVQLLVAGNPGQGWPHPNGHLQVYLGKCSSDTSCSNFDASTAEYFKILSIPNGVPALRAAYDGSRDGNPWNIQIPESVPTGAYVLRAEIIAYGQSSSAEGNQVQLYPFCGQIAVTGGSADNSTSSAANSTASSTNTTGSFRSLAAKTNIFASVQTVKFPDAYASDTEIVGQGIDHVPGPQVASIFGGDSTFSGGSLDGLEPTGSTLGDTAGGSTESSGGEMSGSAPAASSDSGSGEYGGSSSSGGESSSPAASAGEGETPTKTSGEGKGKKPCTKGGKNKPNKPPKQLIPLVPNDAQHSNVKRVLERRARRRHHAQQRARHAETIFT